MQMNTNLYKPRGHAHLGRTAHKKTLSQDANQKNKLKLSRGENKRISVLKESQEANSTKQTESDLEETPRTL
ncbi:unnamed protein product [Caretta caretta]